MMRPTSDCTTARCSAPRGSGFDDRVEFLVLDLLVAFEGDAVEHRGFMQMHDQPLAGALDRDIVEQAGCQHRFQRRIARGFVEASVGRGVEIRTHRLGVDAAIALDLDGLGSPTACRSETSASAAISSAPAAIDRRHRPPGVLLDPSSSRLISHSTGNDRRAPRGAKE